MTAGATLLRQLRDGIAAVHAKDFATAQALLRPVAEAFPGDARPWFWLALASPSAEGAIPCLRRVLEIDASHAQARQALAKLLLTHASSLVTAGRRDDAREIVCEATTLTPDSDRVWIALAIVSGDGAVRLDALRRAQTINPAPATRAHLLHALLQNAQALSAGNGDSARALYHEVLALEPADLRAWHGLTALMNSTADILATVRSLVLAAPGQDAGSAFLKKALVADARALELEGQSEEASVRWREALTLDEFDIDAWLGLAQSTSDDEEAQRSITRAFDIDPTDARVSSAIARMQEATLDAANFEIPADAFAHLDSGDDLFAAAGGELGVLPTAPVAAPVVPVVAELPSPANEDEPASSSAAPADPWFEPIAVAEAPGAVEPAPKPDALVPEVVASSPAAPMGEGRAAASATTRRAVMIVDDSPTIRKILSLTLERAGYKVVAEPDGESALERLTQVIPDVILLDIAMPKIDGYDVCRRIKGDPRTTHVPVVMLSGKDAFFDKVKGRMAGASEYLTKPFETPAVLAAVAAACDDQMTAQIREVAS